MTKRSRTSIETKPKHEAFCDFCGRGFTGDDKLLAHLCEQKRRHLQKDEKEVRLAFIAYQQSLLRTSRSKTPPSYDSFRRSKLYLAFVRFGRHLVALNAVNPRGFIDFLLRLQVPIDRWTRVDLYDTYIRELNKSETPLDALDRTFQLMQKWADETGQDWRDFFRKIEPPLAVLWVSNGRISPWLLFLADSAPEFIARCGPDQLALIERSIDPEFWRLKIERHQANVETIRDVLAEYGI